MENAFIRKLWWFPLFALVELALAYVLLRTGCVFISVAILLLLGYEMSAVYTHFIWYKDYKDSRAQIKGIRETAQRYSVIYKHKEAWSIYATDSEIAMLCQEFFNISMQKHTAEELREIFSMRMVYKKEF